MLDIAPSTLIHIPRDISLCWAVFRRAWMRWIFVCYHRLLLLSKLLRMGVLLYLARYLLSLLTLLRRSIYSSSMMRVGQIQMLRLVAVLLIQLLVV